MFPYTVKYTESESDIRNNKLFYKNTQKCQNTFDLGEMFEHFQKVLVLFYYRYNFHNSYFIFFRYFVFFIYFIYFVYFSLLWRSDDSDQFDDSIHYDDSFKFDDSMFARTPWCEWPPHLCIPWRARWKAGAANGNIAHLLSSNWIESSSVIESSNWTDYITHDI